MAAETTLDDTQQTFLNRYIIIYKELTKKANILVDGVSILDAALDEFDNAYTNSSLTEVQKYEIRGQILAGFLGAQDASAKTTAMELLRNMTLLPKEGNKMDADKLLVEKQRDVLIADIALKGSQKATFDKYGKKSALEALTQMCGMAMNAEVNPSGALVSVANLADAMANDTTPATIGNWADLVKL